MAASSRRPRGPGCVLLGPAAYRCGSGSRGHGWPCAGAAPKVTRVPIGGLLGYAAIRPRHAWVQALVPGASGSNGEWIGARRHDGIMLRRIVQGRLVIARFGSEVHSAPRSDSTPTTPAAAASGGDVRLVVTHRAPSALSTWKRACGSVAAGSAAALARATSVSFLFADAVPPIPRRASRPAQHARPFLRSVIDVPHAMPRRGRVSP